MNENRYAPLYRPPSFASMPKGVWWETVAVGPMDYNMSGMRPELPRSTSEYPFGIIKTDRALTPDEMESFELRAV